MSLKLYNTLERRLAEFSPLVPGRVSLYCCGPTVYNYAHIGNLRTYVFEDLLRRTLEAAGYAVEHVVNVTDVGHLTSDGDEGEDKMIKGARERGMSVWDIAAFFTEAFFTDWRRLGLREPSRVCKATDHITDMIGLIQRLEAKGFTYAAGGNVYFDTGRFPEYGKMALLDLQEAPALSRVEADTNKRHPRDFVLWFTKGKFEDQAMVWDSPWGRGYPGWHIECSAMSVKYLGERFDIHCGGIDHVPVHHTNEIAQTEAATGAKWVNYWLHGEFLVLNKEKMSKSGGGFLTLQKLIDGGYEPLDYRYFLLGGHYRSQLTFSFEALDGARSARRSLNEKAGQWRAAAEGAAAGPGGADSGDAQAAQAYKDAFWAAAFNDLNLPAALAQVWLMAKDPALSEAQRWALVLDFDRLLGLDLASVPPARAAAVPPEILALAEERQAARQARDFARSDALRADLRARGWLVEDGPQGPSLKPV